ncbi:MAG: phosphatidylglycerophosphatase A [Planctomycetaceae bacterium]
MPTRLINLLVLGLATGLGCGYTPCAPGTIGSLWGLALAGGMQAAGLSGISWGLTTALLVLVGIPLCSRAAHLMGRKDPGSVVWDEIAAFPVVFAVVRVTWPTAVLGFLLFRVFDIAKPWPIRRFEQLPAGWGIMADDLIAGAYAGACLAILTDLLPL